MKTTITPAVTKTVEQVISPKIIAVELTVKEAAAVSAIIGNIRGGKKYNDENTGIYRLFSDLSDFIDGEDGKGWSEQQREIVNPDTANIKFN